MVLETRLPKSRCQQDCASSRGLRDASVLVFLASCGCWYSWACACIDFLCNYYYITPQFFGKRNTNKQIKESISSLFTLSRQFPEAPHPSLVCIGCPHPGTSLNLELYFLFWNVASPFSLWIPHLSVCLTTVSVDPFYSNLLRTVNTGGFSRVCLIENSSSAPFDE